MAANWVLDASVVLAFLNRERGHEVLSDLRVGDGAMSSVHLTEVASRLLDLGMPFEEGVELIEDLGLLIEGFDRRQAFAAAQLRFATRPFGLSLGDRACLALALRLGLPVLTADRRWTELDVGVEVIAIR